MHETDDACCASPVRPSQAVHQHRLSTIDNIGDELKNRLQEVDELLWYCSLASPVGNVEGEVVQGSLVETLDICGAVDNRGYSPPLETTQVSGRLK